MNRRIDAHQHFWRYSPEDYVWITSESVLAQSYLPQDLKPLLAAAGITESIAVQARQTDEETSWLLQLADEIPWITGIVGWIDLSSGNLDERLANLIPQKKLLGFRHVVQDEPDPAFLLNPAFQRGVREVLRAGLVYELLVRAAQLNHVPAFLDAVASGPEAARVVIDHGAKPDIAHGEWEPWAGRIAGVARRYPVVCKLSGLVTEAAHGAWKNDEVMRYMRHLLDCFGPQRLIFGSDWPVCLLAGTYERIHALVQQFLEPLAACEREAIMGGNARRTYARIDAPAQGEAIP